MRLSADLIETGPAGHRHYVGGVHLVGSFQAESRQVEGLRCAQVWRGVAVAGPIRPR